MFAQEIISFYSACPQPVVGFHCVIIFHDYFASPCRGDKTGHLLL